MSIQAIKDGFAQFGNYVTTKAQEFKDGCSTARDAISTFCIDHKKKIIATVVVIVAAGVLYKTGHLGALATKVQNLVGFGKKAAPTIVKETTAKKLATEAARELNMRAQRIARRTLATVAK